MALPCAATVPAADFPTLPPFVAFELSNTTGKNLKADIEGLHVEATDTTVNPSGVNFTGLQNDGYNLRIGGVDCSQGATPPPAGGSTCVKQNTGSLNSQMVIPAGVPASKTIALVDSNNPGNNYLAGQVSTGYTTSGPGNYDSPDFPVAPSRLPSNSGISPSGFFLGSISPSNSSNSALTLMTGGNIGACSFFLPFTATVGHITYSLHTSGTSGAMLDIGLYNDSGNLVFDMGAQSSTGGPGVYTVTLGSATTLAPGVYWAAYTYSDTTTQIDGLVIGGTVRTVFANTTSGHVPHTCGIDTTDSSPLGGLPNPLTSINNISNNTAASYPIAFLSP